MPSLITTAVDIRSCTPTTIAIIYYTLDIMTLTVHTINIFVCLQVHYNVGKVDQDKENFDSAIQSYLEAIRYYFLNFLTF